MNLGILLVSGPLLLAAFLLPCSVSAQTVPFHGSTVRFADSTAAAAFLGTADDWVKDFGPFDLQMRLRSRKPVDQAAFLEYAASQARAWNSEEAGNWAAILAEVDDRLDSLGVVLELPDEIVLVKTTGREEGDAGGYTRGTTIIVPEGRARAKRPLAFFLHELFHVMTRHDPEIRKPLYGHIGFQYGGPLAYPQSLIPRKMTNPDAWHFDYYIELAVDDKEIPVVPLTLARTEKYQSGGVEQNVIFEFLAVTLGPDGMEPLAKDGAPVLYTLGETEGYITKIGQNTFYMIHPEEILADNFAMAVLGRTVPSPRIPAAILESLSKKN